MLSRRRGARVRSQGVRVRMSKAHGLHGVAFCRSSSVLPMLRLSGLSLLQCPQLELRMPSRKACSLPLDTRSEPAPICTPVGARALVRRLSPGGWIKEFLSLTVHAASTPRAALIDVGSRTTVQVSALVRIRQIMFMFMYVTCVRDELLGIS